MVEHAKRRPRRARAEPAPGRREKLSRRVGRQSGSSLPDLVREVS
jgi:hypothetical protein